MESLYKYTGIQLSEKQQKLFFGDEILNQTEQLAATLRKSLIETGEREATIKDVWGKLSLIWDLKILTELSNPKERQKLKKHAKTADEHWKMSEMFYKICLSKLKAVAAK